MKTWLHKQLSSFWLLNWLINFAKQVQCNVSPEIFLKTELIKLDYRLHNTGTDTPLNVCHSICWNSWKFLEMCEPIKRLLRTYWESIKNISMTSLGPQPVQQPVYGFGCCLCLSVCFKYLMYLINEYFGSSAFYKNLLTKNKCQQIANNRRPNWNGVVIVSSNAHYQLSLFTRISFSSGFY